MICKSYDQLTIVEKTQFVGRLLHLVQSQEDAFLLADGMLKRADEQGWFQNVRILPKEQPFMEEISEEPILQNASQPFEVINSSDFLSSHAKVHTGNFLHRTFDTISRSYHKIFAKMAS